MLAVRDTGRGRSVQHEAEVDADMSSLDPEFTLGT